MNKNHNQQQTQPKQWKPDVEELRIHQETGHCSI